MRIKMFSLCFIFASSLICSYGVANADTSLDDQKKALDMIADFTDRICKSVPLEGSGSSVELNGEAKAELKGLLKKVANLGIGGTGKYEEKAWSGILQKDLTDILQKNVDCNLKVFESLKDRIILPKQGASTPHADSSTGDKKISSENLVVNGDFSAHWSEGWKKKISDKTDGSIHAETVPSPNDPSDKLLHLHLEDQGSGWVEQEVQLPEGKGIKNLFVEFEMKTKTERRGVNVGEPIEAFFCLLFQDKNGENVGQINFSGGKKGAFEDTGLVGAEHSMKSTDSICVLQAPVDYHKTVENVHHSYMNCFNNRNANNITSVSLAAVLANYNRNQVSDIYIDNVRLYYKD